MVNFIVVRFEGVAHDEEVAAVARDGIPVDHIGEIAGLEKVDCA